MQTLDILSDRIVQPQFTPFAELHDSGRGEALGMRCDAKAVACGELFARGEVGMAECGFGDDLATMRDCDDAAGVLRRPQLEFDPAANVSDGGLDPWLHVRHLPEISVKKCRLICGDRGAQKNPAVMDANRQDKAGATLWIAPAELEI